jgi:hypothetical protein
VIKRTLSSAEDLKHPVSAVSDPALQVLRPQGITATPSLNG